jgi:hypothetical protein
VEIKKKKSQLVDSALSLEENFAMPRAIPKRHHQVRDQSADSHFSVAVRNDFAVQLYNSTLLMKQNCDF